MKKTLTNAEIISLYNTLEAINSRTDLVPGDVDVFFANSKNLKTLKSSADSISEIVQEVINKYFTDDNSHSVLDDDGNETGNRALNDDIKDEIVKLINSDINKIYAKTEDLEIVTIPEESLKKMFSANADKMTFAEMTIMNEFIEESEM